MDVDQNTAAEGRSCDTLLTGGAVITMDADNQIFEPGSIAIKGDRITAVGPDFDLNQLSAKRVIDCSNKAVIPGFVSAHDHLF